MQGSLEALELLLVGGHHLPHRGVQLRGERVDQSINVCSLVDWLINSILIWRFAMATVVAMGTSRVRVG